MATGLNITVLGLWHLGCVTAACCAKHFEVTGLDFDATNLAPRVSCPAIVTVALWDPICPPSTIFGMFRRLANADKELVVLPYQGHDVPYEVDERRLTTLVSRLSRP